jgi:mannosyltransferase
MKQSDSTYSTTPGNGTTRRHATRAAAAVLIGAVAIVALAAALRFEGLARDSLWYDEAISLKYARAPIGDREHWHNGMVLFHAMLHGWIRLADESEAALRFPSAVFGVAAVALLIALVRRVNGWTAALLAGLILAVSWKHVDYSQEARSYSLFIMLAVLSTLLLVRLLERPSTPRLVAYGIALLALAYSHYQWIFVLVSHDAVVLLAGRRVGWGWLMLHAALAVAYVPQLVLGVLPHAAWSPLYAWRYPSVLVVAWTLQTFLSLPLRQAVAGPLPGAGVLNVVSLCVLPLVAVAGAAVCLRPVAARVWPRLRRAAPSSPCAALSWLPLVWLAGVLVVPFLIAQSGKPVFTPRYSAGALPAYCWLIGLGLAALPRTWLRVAAAAVCVLLTVPALETMKTLPMREDWRGCAETIMANERPGDRIVLCDARVRWAFEYYYRGALPTTGVDRDLATDEQLTAALAWDEPPQRVWLVVSHDPTPLIVDYFERRPDFRLASRYDLKQPDIQLMLFERISPPEPDND